MDKEELLKKIWEEYKVKNHGFTFYGFMMFCCEWEAACEQFRRLAGRE